MVVVDKSPTLQDIEKAIITGELPLVMINMKRLHQQDSPHWIVVTGADKENISINDPYNENGKDILVRRENFMQMMNDLDTYSGIAKRVLLLSK